MLSCFGGVPGLEARQAASFGELQTMLKPGDPVAVEASGGIVRGRVVRVSPAAIELESGGASTSLSEFEVTAVTRLRDSLVNGAVIGAIAFGIPTGIMAAGCGSFCGTGSAGEKVSVIAGTMALGAVVGVGIDALVGRSGTIYRAPRSSGVSLGAVPVVGSGVAALRLSIGF